MVRREGDRASPGEQSSMNSQTTQAKGRRQCPLVCSDAAGQRPAVVRLVCRPLLPVPLASRSLPVRALRRRGCHVVCCSCCPSSHGDGEVRSPYFKGLDARPQFETTRHPGVPGGAPVVPPNT